METDLAVRSLSALSHPSRLAAYRALVQAGPGGLAVGELRDALALPAARVTGSGAGSFVPRRLPLQPIYFLEPES